MRQALLTCDRCGHREEVPTGKSAEGWRMIMNNLGAVDHDLCPACDEYLMSEIFTHQATTTAVP